MDTETDYGLHTHQCRWCGQSFPCTLNHENGSRPREICPSCQQRTFQELWAGQRLVVPFEEN
jgi:RNA polymerase subunit RPABC4/transcription elongation factor Spt4